MTHRPVHAANLPKPVGPYSPGMGFERLVFVSGQGATDPGTGKILSADPAAQTEQCLKNVEAILKAAGSDLQHVLRCGVFLIDMKEFAQMNLAYQRMFGDHRPARTTVQAAGLPGEGLRVEIDCIAYIPYGRPLGHADSGGPGGNDSAAADPAAIPAARPVAQAQ